MHLKITPFDEENGDLNPKRVNSPLKDFSVNFRFNQIFGIFPGKINDDWTVFTFNKKFIILTFAIKSIFFVTIMSMLYIWLSNQVNIFDREHVVRKRS